MQKVWAKSCLTLLGMIKVLFPCRLPVTEGKLINKQSGWIRLCDHLPVPSRYSCQSGTFCLKCPSGICKNLSKTPSGHAVHTILYKKKKKGSCFLFCIRKPVFLLWMFHFMLTLCQKSNREKCIKMMDDAPHINIHVKTEDRLKGPLTEISQERKWHTSINAINGFSLFFIVGHMGKDVYHPGPSKALVVAPQPPMVDHITNQIIFTLRSMSSPTHRTSGRLISSFVCVGPLSCQYESFLLNTIFFI